MDFAHPSFLWALWGLLVPLAIHLWSKREARTLKVSSVELLEESHSNRSSRIEIDQWVLLLLRMGAVALLVLLMAGPRWKGFAKADPVAFLVEPSLIGHPGLASILDSLAGRADLMLLREGFPPWEPGTEHQDLESPAYWQLVQGMDSLPADSLVIFARGQFRGIKGKRPESHKKIHWVLIDRAEQRDLPLLARGEAKGTSLIGLRGNGQRLGFSKRALEGPPVPPTDSLILESGDAVPYVSLAPLRVKLLTQDGLDPGEAYIRAALGALSIHLDRSIEIEGVEGPGSDPLAPADLYIWLRADPPPTTKGRWLVYREDPLAGRLIEKEGEGLHYLTSVLDPENSVRDHFAQQLLPLLDPAPQLWARVEKLDYRQMDPLELQARTLPSKGKREGLRSLELSPWLMVLLALLLGVERLVSRIKQQ